jgi:hypothetical protein
VGSSILVLKTLEVTSHQAHPVSAAAITAPQANSSQVFTTDWRVFFADKSPISSFLVGTLAKTPSFPLNPAGGHFGEGEGMGFAVFFATTLTSDAALNGSEEVSSIEVATIIVSALANISAILPYLGENISVSPRRNKPKKRNGRNAAKPEERDLAASHETIEEHSEGIYMVRRITGSSSTKPYRCPGCDQLIPMATPHTVAWIEHDVESRRHWHTPCWNKRDARKPKIERTRNAPRY